MPANNFLFSDGAGAKSTKYQFGDVYNTTARSNNYTLAFAYDYISVAQSKLCFDNTSIPPEDYWELFYLKKEISRVTISSLFDDRKYRFHRVALDESKKWLLPLISELLEIDDIDDQDVIDQLPTLYQIAIFTAEDAAPRLVGFIGNYGIFHLLWFDYHHSIYPMDVKPKGN